MSDKNSDEQGASLVSSRTMDIVVAAVLLLGSLVVMFDSLRTGIGWKDDGPQAGFFPFWVATLLAIASIINLIKAIPDREAAAEAFVTRPAFGRVLAVAFPTLVYIAAIAGVGPIPGLGIYLASAMFIGGFMAMLSESIGGGVRSRAISIVLVSIANGAVYIALMLLFKVAGGSVSVVGVVVPFALVAAVVLAAQPFGGVVAKLVTIGPAVAITMFVMFEVWFQTPLIKGPVEALLGMA